MSTWVPNQTTCAASSGSSVAFSQVEGFPGDRVDVRFRVRVPDRPAGVPVVEHSIHCGPPGGVVGGPGHGFDDASRDGATDGGVQVRREAALGLDGGEVLDLVPGAAAQVLPERSNSRGHNKASRAARR